MMDQGFLETNLIANYCLDINEESGYVIRIF